MLTADPFNAKVHAFLNRVNHDRPAKIPELSETDLKRFLEVVDLTFGYEVFLTTNTVLKLKPVLCFQGDLFLWAEQFTGFYDLRAYKGYNELWKDNKCIAIKTI